MNRWRADEDHRHAKTLAGLYGRVLRQQLLFRRARSQIIGAMTMGVGAALMEELAVDKRLGFFVSHDLAGYEVPVHADIPRQEVIIFLDEPDRMSSPMKTKGVAELGIILGWKTRLTAFLLAGFTLLSAFIFHHNFGDQIQMIMFLKNISIAGGFLLLMANGAGPLSLDHRFSH